ncbi:MAG TPA: hypothetical protein VKA21_14060 [Candidatus Binatia bacterium]|nr:hypothetical protein [Candidatus Binatia bacterium]
MRRRAAALIVLLALLGSVPKAAPRGCVDCPPGCPMHARRDGAPEARRLGCHRTRPVEGTVCLRSACGHDALAESPAGPPAIFAARTVVPRIPVSERVLERVPSIASLAAPEPPTEPPRTFLA